MAAEIAAPTAVRRLVSFCEAVYEGQIEVAGVDGVLISKVDEAEVGSNADVVIETHREAGPGKVITQGCAMAHTGVPGVIKGESIRRVLRAPGVGRMVGVDGLKVSGKALSIGDGVLEGLRVLGL